MTDTAVDRGTGGRKGRPRDERIDEDITSAALDLLSTEGFDRFSVEAVAARAAMYGLVRSAAGTSAHTRRIASGSCPSSDSSAS